MSNLRILSANVMKSSEVCQSLLNDEKLKDFSFLLLSEPWANIRANSPHSAPQYHTHWQPFFPSALNLENIRNTIAFRSMIWASKDLHCKQIAIPHPDITGLTSQICNRFFLIISMYIPCSSGQTKIDQQNLITQMPHIHQAFETEKSQNPKMKLILTGNFNCWDSYWGGDAIGSHFWQGKGAKLIEFMSNLGLVQLLQRGTQTCYSFLGTSFIIDLVFTSEQLARDVLECKLHNTHYGSNHEAIELQFDLQWLR